ncbi:hypothetical protein V8E36_008164 [Tilletia maclaganii]
MTSVQSGDTLKADIEQVHRQLLSKSPIYNFVLQQIEFVQVSPPPSSAESDQPASSSAAALPPPPPTPSAFVLAHLPLSAVHLNSHQSLHGAVAATIVDWVGGIVIATFPRSPTTTTSRPPGGGDGASAEATPPPPSALTTPRGVSVDIHLRYLSAAAKLGHTLQIRAWSHKIGRTLAFVTVQLSVQIKKPGSEVSSPVVVVEASHTKYIS